MHPNYDYEYDDGLKMVGTVVMIMMMMTVMSMRRERGGDGIGRGVEVRRW